MTFKELNFKKLIQLDMDNIENYCFKDYIENEWHHRNIVGYCTSCEEKGINTCDERDFYLQNISHGAHSNDFLEAITEKIDTSNWNADGVMFIMESPSRDYGIYESLQIEKNGVTYNKRPSKDWYWIHNAMDISGYPQHFKGGTYGELVASAIVTFKLSNAYMTNLVKCGLNGPNDTFKGIGSYNPCCIENCYNEFLKNEISYLNPKIIFTFGTAVYDYVKSYVGNNITVVGLPHPAGRRRGFKDEFYNVLYFCMIAKGLYRENIINENSYLDAMKKFAEKDLSK